MSDAALTVPDPDRQPWQQQAGEDSRDYHAYLHFARLMPWERSTARAYTAHLRECRHRDLPAGRLLSASPTWKARRIKFSWPERAAAFDADVAQRERAQRLAALAQMNERHVNIAVALQNLAVQRLQLMQDQHLVPTMSMRELVWMIEKATLVERRARGAATDIVQTVSSDRSPLLDLSHLTDSELAIFESLLARVTTTPVN